MWRRWRTTRWTTKAGVVAALVMILGTSGTLFYAWAQATQFFVSNIAPQVNGTSTVGLDVGLATRKWRHAYFAGTVTANQFSPQLSAPTTLTVGNGTTITKMQVFSQVVSPSLMAAPAGPAGVFSSAEQTVTVNGLTTADKVFVNGPAQTALCPYSSVRVSAASTLAITFLQLTTGTCQPATGTFNITAIRS